MKENYKNIILFVLLFFIWGYFFKSFFATVDNSENINFANNNKPIKQIEQKEQFEYQLLLDYDNPFKYIQKNKVLQKEVPQVIAPKIIMNPTPKKEKIKKEIVRWPTVAYKGWIKKQLGYKNSAFLEINGVQEKVSEGKSLDKIKLIKVWQDSILVSYKDSMRYLKLLD